MKKIFSLILFILMILSVFGVQANEHVTLSVNEDKIVRTADMRLYGVGSEWSYMTGLYFFETKSGAIQLNNKIIEDLKEEGISFEIYRVAGVTSVGYNWKTDLGDIFSRAINEGLNKTYHYQLTSLGIVEVAKLAKAFSDNYGLLYTISMIEEDPQDVANLAEFLYSDGTYNYNGGTNWGEVRKECGFDEPINVILWELGNEYDRGGNHNMFINSEKYVQQCKEYIAAIRSVKPDAEIALCAPMSTSEISTNTSEWLYRSFLEISPYVNYFQKHGYFTRDSIVSKMVVNFEDTIAGIAQVTDKPIKIVNSEWAATDASNELNETDGSDGSKYAAPLRFSGGRAVANGLCRMAAYTDMGVANYFTVNGENGRDSAKDGSYSLWYYDKFDDKYKLNVSGYALAMFQKYAIGDVLDIDFGDYEYNKDSDYAALAVKDKDGYLNIILVNYTDDGDLFVDFDFENKYTLVEKQTVSANSLDAINWVNHNQISRVTEKYNDGSIIDGCKVDKFSFTALKLKEIKQ